MAEAPVIDVGHGSAAVVQADGRVVVIDAGPRSGLLEYLLQEGIGEIDLVVLSHADADHVRGLVGILGTGIQVKRVRLNSDALKGSKLWGDLLHELNARAHSIDVAVSLTVSQTAELSDESLGVEVLAPSLDLAGRGPGGTTSDGATITTHMMSAVLRISRQGQPVAVFFGDLDEAGLGAMLAAGVDPSAPLLVFPHHGGGAGGADARAFAARLCHAVEPSSIVFSIGRGRHGTPRPEVVEAARDAVPGVRIACTQLSANCARTLGEVRPTHLHPAFALGRERGQCCAGTIILDLEDASIQPSPDTHLAFIREAAPSALCM